MDLVTYAQLSAKTEKPYELTRRLQHAALGVDTETGEFATQVKRVAIYEKDITSTKDGLTLAEHMDEELGDAMFYCVIPFNAYGRAPWIPEHRWALSKAHQLGINLLLPLSSEDQTRMLGLVRGEMAIVKAQIEQNLYNSPDMALAPFATMMGLIADACGLIGRNFGETLERNVDKLQGANGRYDSAGYSNAAAEARADKGGADARSS